MDNKRLTDFAYKILKSHTANDPYKEILMFAEVLASLDTSTETQRCEYEIQAATMEQTASICLQVKEQLLKEYNEILEQQEQEQQPSHGWLMMGREMQA